MSASNSRSVALPAVLDLDAIDGVRDLLSDAIEAGDVSVSGARVERVSTNGLLLLVSAAETAARNAHGFAIKGASGAMLAAIERLGLTKRFAAMIKE